MYWFTADQHFNHKKEFIWKKAGFSSSEEKDEIQVQRHNEVVRRNDIVIHAGDFAFVKTIQQANEYFKRLNGNHIYLKGSHDKWMPKHTLQIWEKTIEGQFLVVCHYNMRTWHRSHYNSWQLFAHSHGRLEPVGKQHDIGVDNNNFYPVSFEQLREIMKNRPDNFNFIRDKR